MKFSGLRIYAFAFLVFLYAPIVLLPLFAFNDSTVVAFPLKGFTTQWFQNVWNDSDLWQAVRNSLLVAVSASVIATIFGIFAARASTRYAFPGKGPVMGLIMLPMVLPDMIMAMALLVVLLAMNVQLSLLTVIMGHVLICTPFAVAILSSAFQSLDKSLEEAAYDLGEGPVSTFYLVILPLVTPGIISALLISFTISLDEFVVSNFLGSKDKLLSVYIFGQLRFPKSVPTIMALGAVLVALSITLLALAEYFRRRGVAKTGLKDSGGFL
ncbi:MAG: ABC transporter permease [Pseudorhodobacter sp.]|nr:ABC transporter permease [Pseudorhodobacter sp.]